VSVIYLCAKGIGFVFFYIYFHTGIKKSLKYQKKPKIEKGQTKQGPKEKGQTKQGPKEKEQTNKRRSIKHCTENQRRSNTNSH
jgi:hypothetical protein